MPCTSQEVCAPHSRVIRVKKVVHTRVGIVDARDPKFNTKQDVLKVT